MPSSHSDCGCSAAWRQPTPNGTCATCGGWLPGERPAPLPWLGDDLKKAGGQIKRYEALSGAERNFRNGRWTFGNVGTRRQLSAAAMWCDERNREAKR